MQLLFPASNITWQRSLEGGCGRIQYSDLSLPLHHLSISIWGSSLCGCSALCFVLRLLLWPTGHMWPRIAVTRTQYRLLNFIGDNLVSQCHRVEDISGTLIFPVRCCSHWCFGGRAWDLMSGTMGAFAELRFNPIFNMTFLYTPEVHGLELLKLEAVTLVSEAAWLFLSRLGWGQHLNYICPHSLVVFCAGTQSGHCWLSLPLTSVFHGLFRRAAVTFFLLVFCFNSFTQSLELEKEETGMPMLLYLIKSFMGVNFICCISQGSLEQQNL